MTDQFLRLLKKQDESGAINLLQAFTPEQKKAFVPDLKKLIKEYFHTNRITKGNTTTFEMVGSETQKNILLISCFVVFNRTDFEKIEYPSWIMNDNLLSKVIDWYYPDWFSEFINKQFEKNLVYYTFNYEVCMKLVNKGILVPSKRVIINLLPQLPYDYKDKKPVFSPDKLLQHEITLKEHLWYLFEEESGIHVAGRYMNFGEDVNVDEIHWIPVLKRYCNENRIDRQRLLKESLLAGNRNFNKVLSGWFSQLFTELAPTTEECLGLQKELISVLSSPHSKVVNTALQSIKNISEEKEFNTASFLDAVPVLLSSDTKATIVSTLAILEKMLQKNIEHCEDILMMICQSFIHADEALQTKAAKIIAKYGDSKSQNLRSEINGYYSNMLTAARKLLTGFCHQEMGKESISAINQEKGKYESQIPEPIAIPFPKNLDDLFFLASQAFDNNETWHIDLLPAALIHFHPQLKDDDIQRFEPAFQRAFSLIKGGYRSSQGYVDSLLANFFIDYGNWLIKTFPSASKSIEKIYRSNDSKSGEKIASFLVSPTGGSYTANWETHNKIEIYTPYKKLLLVALKKIKEGDLLPLLSTPTFRPSWLSPLTLADRLHLYQQSGVEPADIDLQIAVSRCYLIESKGEINSAIQKLSGELRNLMSFLLINESSPKKPSQYKAAWMVASLTRNERKEWPEFESLSYYKYPISNYTGDLKWKSVVENYSYNQYDFETKKYKDVPAKRKSSSILREYEKNEKKGLRKIFANLVTTSKDDPPMLYEYMAYQVQYLSIEYNDIKRILSLIPNNPESILTDTYNKCLQYPEFWEETSRKTVVAVMEILYEIWQMPGEMAKLFLGTCMLSADKTIANIAGELWLKAVSEKAINNAELGKIIGIHESIEFAPLKRFTDLAIQNFFRVSPLHNSELQILIENILLQLPDEPIKNLKKLLEIYQELIAVNHSSVMSPGVINRLRTWEKNAGLRKIVGALTN